MDTGQGHIDIDIQLNDNAGILKETKTITGEQFSHSVTFNGMWWKWLEPCKSIALN